MLALSLVLSGGFSAYILELEYLLDGGRGIVDRIEIL